MYEDSMSRKGREHVLNKLRRHKSNATADTSADVCHAMPALCWWTITQCGLWLRRRTFAGSLD
jgi:hypothetical protein